MYVGATSGPLHLPNGAGKVFFPNGRLRSDGHFVDGLMNGAGVRHFKDGSVYTGNFVDGLREGIGRLRLAGGRVYEGQFANNRANGFGVLCPMKWNEIRCGMWSDDRFRKARPVPRCLLPRASRLVTIGMSIMIEFRSDILLMPEGGYYAGAINADSLPHGRGIHYDHDRRPLCSGEWIDGQPHGQAQIRYKKSLYCGNMVAGSAAGLGVKKFDHGGIIAGTWSREGDKQVLIGIELNKEGQIVKVGRWLDKVFASRAVPLSALPCADLPQLTKAQAAATLLIPNGSCYTGATNAASQRHGEGVMRAADGKELQRGVWCNDEFNPPLVKKTPEEKDDGPADVTAVTAVVGSGCVVNKEVKLSLGSNLRLTRSWSA